MICNRFSLSAGPLQGPKDFLNFLALCLTANLNIFVIFTETRKRETGNGNYPICGPSKRIRVVSALGRFGLSRFGLGRFGKFWGWVVSALVGGSFRPIFWVSRLGPESFRPKFMEIFK